MSAGVDQLEPDTSPIDVVPGDATGLSLPAHPDALVAAGPAFLTQAFHRFGALALDDQVVRIIEARPCPGGSTGAKLFLTLEFAHRGPETLFVKFSRDFTDPLRDRGRHEMESEVRFAALSRAPGFPIDVPTAWFADYHAETGAGVLISEVIAFGRNGIEPQHQKCMDHLLADPAEYYRTLLSALARIAAADRSGALSGEVERLFPFDHDAAVRADAIPWDEAALARRIDDYAAFAHECPRLMPEAVRDPGFWTMLREQAPRFLRHEAAIKRFLHADPEMIALCHWNANIDNAWFRRDAEGALSCGLMDWGRAQPLNLAYSIWGCLACAPHALWETQLDDLIGHFMAELHRHGGPRLDPDRLRLNFDLYVATMGLAWLIEAPMRIRRYLPEAAEITGPLDPRLLANERARNQRHVSTLFLSLWRRHDFGAALDRMLAETTET